MRAPATRSARLSARDLLLGNRPKRGRDRERDGAASDGGQRHVAAGEQGKTVGNRRHGKEDDSRQLPQPTRLTIHSQRLGCCYVPRVGPIPANPRFQPNGANHFGINKVLGLTESA